MRYGDLYTQHQFFIAATRSYVAPELANTVYTPIRYGDVLFAGSGETIDEIGKSAVNLIPGPACCGGDVIILRPSINADARFLGYAMDCAATARQKACIGRGFTVVHIYSSDLKYVTVAIPSLTEQAAIVRFLDHADRRIQGYIRAKQNLIARLEEQKQVIFHQAVTHGLEISTKLRPTGNPWFPSVPAHWNVMPLRRVITRSLDGPHHSPEYLDQGIPFLSASMGGSKPAICGHLKTGHFRRPETGVEIYFTASSVGNVSAGALAVTPEASGQLDSLQYRQIQLADLLEQRCGRGPGKRFRQRVPPLPVLFLQLQERLHGVVPLLWSRSPVRWPTVPGPGFAGLAPLPVTCLPLRVRQRHTAMPHRYVTE